MTTHIQKFHQGALISNEISISGTFSKQNCGSGSRKFDEKVSETKYNCHFCKSSFSKSGPLKQHIVKFHQGIHPTNFAKNRKLDQKPEIKQEIDLNSISDDDAWDSTKNIVYETV